MRAPIAIFASGLVVIALGGWVERRPERRDVPPEGSVTASQNHVVVPYGGRFKTTIHATDPQQPASEFEVYDLFPEMKGSGIRDVKNSGPSTLPGTASYTFSADPVRALPETYEQIYEIDAYDSSSGYSYYVGDVTLRTKVLKAPTEVRNLRVAAPGAVAGRKAVFKADLVAPDGEITPRGRVRFKLGDRVLGRARPMYGLAKVRARVPVEAGSQQLKASFVNDGGYFKSSMAKRTVLVSK